MLLREFTQNVSKIDSLLQMLTRSIATIAVLIQDLSMKAMSHKQWNSTFYKLSYFIEGVIENVYEPQHHNIG
jgi:hypothetical protein